MISRVIPLKITSVSAQVSPTTRNIALVVIASVAVVAPVWIYGVPSNIDLFNHFRFALPFYDALRSGHFYPGWLAESNAGYGDPSFRFYPPALYYLLAAARALTGDWYAGTLLTITSLSVLGGLGMYFWARLVLPDKAAIWAAILYAFAPYHLNQLYQAFLLAEYAGAALLPFAFGFVELVSRRGRWRDVAGLASTYALLILTHLPLALIGSLALAVYAFTRTDWQHGREYLKKISAAAILGLAASAVYWVKMITELRWIAINNVRPDSSVDYRLNFLFSTFSPVNLNVWWMNILALMTLLLFAPAVAFFCRKKRNELDHDHVNAGSAGILPAKSVLVLAFFSLFMATVLSWPLWKILPPLQQTQFPWRWLAVFSMGGSVLAGATLPLWLKNEPAPSHVIKLLVLGGMFVSVSFTLAHTVREAQYRNPDQFRNDLESVRGTASVGYWLPIWASATPASMSNEVAAANRSVTIDNWEPEHRSFKVSSGDPTEARVRTFYYPHWLATANGNVLPTRPDHDGALLVSLPADTVSVELRFREPKRLHFATASSALGWMLIGFLAAPVFVRRKS